VSFPATRTAEWPAEVAPGPEVPPGPRAGLSQVVAIESLRPADSPRVRGQDAGHAHALRENLPDLPAILVNRRTMRVIDGMHRLSAARLAGADTIRAEFIDTDERTAFLLGVQANTRRGLPLSLADRKAAAERILSWYPYWSDRAVATIAGLAATTVGAIRERSTVGIGQLNARIGRDGRVRPVSALDGRRRASEIIAARPDAALREVAIQAGISLGTAHNVRERMRRGQDSQEGGPWRPAPARGRGRGRAAGRRHGEPLPWQAARERLVKDPALRYAEAGRVLVRWLDARTIGAGDWRGVIDAIPSHWVETIIDVAQSCGNEWHELAAALEQRNALACEE
jgi:ParB-like chromosome segregation protein Spo0J